MNYDHNYSYARAITPNEDGGFLMPPGGSNIFPINASVAAGMDNGTATAHAEVSGIPPTLFGYPTKTVVIAAVLAYLVLR